MSTTSSGERLKAALAGRYEVEREIGRGGMATVYLARDVRHDRPVALKVMSPELQQAPERFLAEIRTAANLQHPNILPLFDSGEADGLLFYTMPFVEGGVTLEDRLKDGPLGLEETLRVVREIGEGLAHAHKQGLIHRDVKPSNVLYSSGHALLADFGLARAVERGGTPGLTKTGHYVGSPQYMAPEQAFGNAEVDARADLYSLACVCYEMLTGKPPYQGDTALAVITAHAFDEIPSAVAASRELPAFLDSVIARAMAKEPAQRFASVQEFLDALGAGMEVARPKSVRKGKTKVARLASWGVGAAAVFSVAGTTYVVLTRPEAATAAPALVAERVVIAPLENRTGDPSLDQIGRMAADWITEGLHRTGVVDVVPSATALQAAAYVASLGAAPVDARKDPITALAEETGAGKVVDGNFYLLGDSLQFSMQVTDAITGTLIQAFDPVRASPASPQGAIETLRDYVMSTLSVTLDERLANVDHAQMQPPSYESYRAFDEGMQRYLAGDWAGAAEGFRAAYDIDTTFVLSLQYRALSESNLGPRGSSAMDSLTQVLTARRGKLAEYHQHWLDYLVARVRGDNESARLAIMQAAELAPGSKAVYNFAFTSQLTRRPQEAVDALETLDPKRGAMRGWFPYWTMLTDNLHRLGDHGEELAKAREATALHPELGWSIRQEGEALAALGRMRDMREIATRIETLDFRDIPKGDVWIGIGDELRFHGHEEEAMQFFQSALAWYDALPDSAKQRSENRFSYATALQAARRFRDARQVVEELQSASPRDMILVGWLGILDAWLGNDLAAIESRERMKQLELSDPYARGLYELQAARISGALGEREEATRLLNSAVARGYRPLRHPDMNFEKVRGYEPFEESFTPRGE
jgi:serine/threonine-protein kinase